MSILERVDRDILLKEQREKEDREFYENTLDEISESLDRILLTAKDDQIEDDDIIDLFRQSFKDCFNRDIEFVEAYKLKNLGVKNDRDYKKR